MPGRKSYISAGLRTWNWSESLPSSATKSRLVERLINGLTGVDAQQDVVGQVVILGQVVSVAGGHDRQAEPRGQVELARHAVALNLKSVVLDLDEKVALAKGLVIPHGQFLCLGDAIAQEELRELGSDAS